MSVAKGLAAGYVPLGAMVAQLAGVHYFDLGDAVPVYFRPDDVYVFDSAGMLALAPTREGVH